MTRHTTPQTFILAYTAFILLASTSSVVFSASSTEVSASSTLAYLKHENYDADDFTLNTESGLLPGVKISASNTSRRLKSIFSFELNAGDINYSEQTSSGVFSSQTSERLSSLSYRLRYSRPRNIFSFYADASFNDWLRETQTKGTIEGVTKQYQWWRAELGMQFKLLDSPRNELYTGFGLSYSVLNEMLLDLTPKNLGKPLLKLKNKAGGSIDVRFTHRFTRKHSGGMFAKMKYWQFGASDKRAISNNAVTENINEPQSQSLSLIVGATYSYRF